MKALFGLAFSTQYRADLVLDGIASSIETGMGFLPSVRRCFISPTEYKKSAERLGDVDVLDPTPWHTELLRDWYWDFLMEVTLDLPMVRRIVIFLLHFKGRTFPGNVCIDTSGLFVVIVHRFDGASAASYEIDFVEHRSVHGRYAVLVGRLLAGQAAL